MDKLFEYSDATDTAPACICKECAALAVKHKPTDSIFVYCSHSQSGALQAPGRPWVEARGVEAEAFQKSLVLAVLEGEALATDAAVGGNSRH